MIDTELKANTENLCRLVKEIATPATLEMIADEWNDCPEGERVELVMEAYFTFEQRYIIVKIISTNTWGLILDTLDSMDDAGDNAELMALIDSGTVVYWFQ